MWTEDDHFHDECAVVGVWGPEEAANLCYLSLYALQHRGQEGSGIASYDGRNVICHKAMGLVADVFPPSVLETLPGRVAIGHNRYATFGSKDLQNLQPFVANFKDSPFSIAHNGNLTNATELRSELEALGAIFQSTSDTEVILHLIARESHNGNSCSGEDLKQIVARALKRVEGAYSLTLLWKGSLLAIRDPYGVRPLSIASLGSGYVVASESCAFDLVDAKFIRDIAPGEILQVTADGELQSLKMGGVGESAACVFEHIYFARPDSKLWGENVYSVRKRLGAELAKEHPAEADLVIPVPDSGVPAAIGYAEKAGLPMEFGLIRNHYVGRTFIEPRQSIRDFGVRVKLNANHEVLSGKRIVVVDDSIVRGTTCRKIIKMLRRAGAREIHFRVSSPPTIGPCYYGIDTPSSEELIANTHSLEETRVFIDADSLGYLSVPGIYRAVRGEQKSFCDACFTRNYRLGIIS
jgi:amidophosphoribosyltransferase